MSQQLKKMREQYAGKEIQIGRACTYVASAAAFAAAASDFVDMKYAGGLGNFGLVLIILRIYFNVPRVIAQSIRPNEKWYKLETQYLIEKLPWVDVMGRAGWIFLFSAVICQMFLGIS